MIGYLIGMMPAFWLAMTGKAKTDGQHLRTAVLSVFSKKVLVAILVFLFSYALLQNVLTYPYAFMERMSHWIGGPGVTNYNKGFRGQLPLLWQSCWTLYGSFGWPMLAIIIISLPYCIIRYPWISGLMTIPLIIFYLLVVMNVRMSAPRYFMPGFVGLALLTGKGCADWLRWQKLPLILRIFPLAFVYILSLLYCVGLDLEMVGETRYRAQEWLTSHVGRNDCVIALSSPTYAPRIETIGCKYYFIGARPKTEEVLKKIRPYADYLVLGECEYSMTGTFEQDFLKALLEGKRGYKEVARFSHKYLYPKRTVFGFAGRPIGRTPAISPEIIILRKEDSFQYNTKDK